MLSKIELTNSEVLICTEKDLVSYFVFLCKNYSAKHTKEKKSYKRAPARFQPTCKRFFLNEKLTFNFLRLEEIYIFEDNVILDFKNVGGSLHNSGEQCVLCGGLCD